MGRYIKWRASDIEDHKRFPKYDFKASVHPFQFYHKNDDRLSNLNVSTGKGKTASLLKVLKESGTTAFLVIKNDTILYEKYLNGYQKNSINTSFSVAKSITSLLTGIAVDTHLFTPNDPVVAFFPELFQIDPTYNKVRIADVLDMRSGIRFIDHDLPWGDKPKVYYTPNLKKRILELPLENTPGTVFKYNSYNPVLMGMIIEKTTKQQPAIFFEQKLWNQMGMEYPGSWSMDSKGSGMTKMESGLNIRAVDFAKFGRLVLHKGNWNGKQLIATGWFDYSFALAEKYRLPDFANDLYYRNFWWIYAGKNKTGYQIKCIAGTGHLGQYLFIFPHEKTIIVRMGKKNTNVDSWRTVFEEIVRALNNWKPV